MSTVVDNVDRKLGKIIRRTGKLMAKSAESGHALKIHKTDGKANF